jgi:hypothetical protein
MGSIHCQSGKHYIDDSVSTPGRPVHEILAHHKAFSISYPGACSPLQLVVLALRVSCVKHDDLHLLVVFAACIVVVGVSQLVAGWHSLPLPSAVS